MEKSSSPLWEHENEQAVGGLRNAARAVDRVPGWKLVGRKLSEVIGEVVSDFDDELDKVLSGFGRETASGTGHRGELRVLAKEIDQLFRFEGI